MGIKLAVINKMKTLFEKNTERFVLKLQAPPDNIKLFIDLAPVAETAPVPAITREEVLSVIESGLRITAIDTTVLDDVIKYVNRGEAVTERRIKKGREPETGTDGKIVFLVKKFTGKGEMHEDANGRVALSNLHLFDNVRNGQVVARLYPPKAGRDGEDVFGKCIPSKPGAAIKAKVDATLRIEEPASAAENYQRVVALCDGYITEDSGTLQVHDELHVKGDVDFHYGNIDFIGKVSVSGDVHPGFGVTAVKGVVIRGGIQESRLRCTEGDIEIKGFAFGGKNSMIVGGQGVIGTVMHEITAEVVGNIVVQKEAIDCTFRTQSSVLMPSARLIGGKVMCVCGLEAKEIGNEAGQNTLVTLANSVEVGTEYCQLLVQIANHDQAIKLIELHLGPYAYNTARVQLLSLNHRSRMEALLHKRKELEESRLRLLAKKVSMLESGKWNALQRVSFHKALFPGVRIVSGEHVFAPKEIIPGPATIEFDQETQAFVTGDLRPIECNLTTKPNNSGHTQILKGDEHAK